MEVVKQRELKAARHELFNEVLNKSMMERIKNTVLVGTQAVRYEESFPKTKPTVFEFKQVATDFLLKKHQTDVDRHDTEVRESQKSQEEILKRNRSLADRTKMRNHSAVSTSFTKLRTGSIYTQDTV